MATLEALPEVDAAGRVVVRPVDDDDRARWIGVAEHVRASPAFLPYVEERDPGLYSALVAGLQSLAIEARSVQWRDSRPGRGARPEQLIPGTEGAFSDRTDWLVWLLLGGRGGGKSRTGAEAIRELILGRKWVEPPRVALVGMTLDAVRIDMVENTLLQILPPGSVRKWNRGTCELWLTNGAYMKGYSAEAAQKLRGPNFHLAWADEVAAWKDADCAPSEESTWSNLVMAVRADDAGTWAPRIIATTTPKPRRLLRVIDDQDEHYPGLADDPDTVVSVLKTVDNLGNLAGSFRKTVVRRFEGTRLGSQELEGVLLDDVEGAQWTADLIEQMRFDETYPELFVGGLGRIVVGVDPSTGDGSGDECGIVVCGLAGDGKVYVLEDASLHGSPDAWVKQVASVYRKWAASAVVVETQGSLLVEETLGRYVTLPIIPINAKKGKMLRAEPVALLSDQDRVRFAGRFPALEAQMRTYNGSGDSPDRLDAFVIACLDLLPVETGAGDLISYPRRSRL